MNYSELLRNGCKELEKAGIFEWSNDARQLLMFLTGFSRAKLLMIGNDEAPDTVVAEFNKLISQRANRKPLQYITHEQNFMGYDFYVDERVLIPRYDTEVLVSLVLETVSGLQKNNGDNCDNEDTSLSLLDMCCGSGCIGIALQKSGLFKSVTGADISEDALAVSRINSDKLAANVSFIKSDLFSNIEGIFDIIVSNPPYIETEEIEKLENEVKLHEPGLALDGGVDGLDLYKRIIKESVKHINKNGWLFFEIGYNQGEAVKYLMEQSGYKEVSIKKDLAGLDRCVYGHL